MYVFCSLGPNTNCIGNLREFGLKHLESPFEDLNTSVDVGIKYVNDNISQSFSNFLQNLKYNENKKVISKYFPDTHFNKKDLIKNEAIRKEYEKCCSKFMEKISDENNKYCFMYYYPLNKFERKSHFLKLYQSIKDLENNPKIKAKFNLIIYIANENKDFELPHYNEVNELKKTQFIKYIHNFSFSKTIGDKQNFVKLINEINICEVQQLKNIETKYIVYKATGGLAHSLGGLWKCLKKAKEMQRFLIIDYLSHSAFKHNFSDFFYIENTIPYSDNYNSIPQHMKYRDHSIDELKKEQAHSIGPAYCLWGESVKISGKNYFDDIVVSAGTSGKKGWVYIHGLRVTQKIMEKLQKEPKIMEKYISIHYRNTDIKNRFSNFIAAVNNLKDKNIKTIYLATDDFDSIHQFNLALPNMKIINYTIPEKNVYNLHYYSKDKYKQIYECIRDIYMIFQSEYFIPSGNSGLSRLIMTMIENKYNMFNLQSNTKII